ncbi:hypothetical protein [Piscinibacter sp. HJYY11]|uniref:hypothetical protein n=1 Tax=Piscinibacter sp. HJYY11 TaxID=2801333 RepID=UPI00191F8EDB|nr:hypothetical protein [Piscinibacter sp. HJYY11]MBL0728190.1 hypothetical protein [Piscinibacter sp. HJYY11]
MKTVLLLLASITCVSAHAQAVYRCGADGRSYSQAPCAEGRAVEVKDERSAQQRREAIEVAERDRALGDSLQQDRLVRESQPRAGAGKIDGRIGYARVAQVEPAKKTGAPKKKRSPKAPGARA